MLGFTLILVVGAWVCGATMGIAGFVAWVVLCNVSAVAALWWVTRKLNEEGVLQ